MLARFFDTHPWKLAMAWLAGLAPFFFLSYRFANWVTGLRHNVPSLVFGWEHRIPFLPWTILPYWSTDLLYGLSLFICSTREELNTHAKRLLSAQVISVAGFLLFPLRFSFPAPHTDGLFGWLFATLYGFDKPFNQAPSLHLSLTVLLWAEYSRHLRGAMLWLMRGWMILVGISTLTTYQHHFIALPAGIWVGLLSVALFPFEKATVRSSPSPEPSPEPPATQALVLFHRGHEHSGRLDELARRLGLTDFAVFAWDARGHGKSPGDRGWADSFACLVRDADCFVRHTVREHGIATENLALVAHSVGAAIAAAWVHDYAPPIRAMVLASPAFRVKLYVPFALPFLRLRRKLQRKAYVKSYVRPGMLTHDQAESESYARDPLISRAVSVNLLVDMHDRATRTVADAGAIRTPTLLLSSGKDYVVRLPVQREFFRRLGSPFKEMREYDGFYHDLWHERDRAWPIEHARDFLRRAFELTLEREPPAANHAEYERLSRQPAALSPAGFKWGAERLFLKIAGKLSRGIGAGWRSGFDSGDSLDYVYRNQPEGATPLGRLIDRVYLNSPGWRGIRERKAHVEELLRKAIGLVRAEGKPVHIFDPAAGGGRYVIETVSRLGGAPVSVTLRDWNRANVEAASKLARELKLEGFSAGQGDAFDRRSLAGVQPRPGIAIVSGLYELFADNGKVRESLLGLADALGDDGYLIYTNQPWHPQLETIARVLDNREGKPWVMRCRSQAEMDALVDRAGFEKLETLLDADGIFTVSLARRRAATRELEAGLSRASGGRP